MAEEKIVLISSDGQLWNLPGGTLELGESPEEALIREVDGGRRS
jgi:8-oxo-dGTP pyrophosphatase MutT (NUDIX family)